MGKKKRITKKVLFALTIEILKPILHLNDWTITVINTKKMDPAADCEASPEYKEAVIRLNLKQLPYLSYTQTISMAIHEMVHNIVWPLAEWTVDLCDNNDRTTEVTRKLEEGLVTNLEKILYELSIGIILDALREQGYDINI